MFHVPSMQCIVPVYLSNAMEVTIRYFLKFYTFHFMECTFGRREEPTKNSMTEAALIVSSYLTPFVNLSM
jgi:hypothetical protein